MTCPECGSNRIHRSRRHGTLEHGVLPAIGVLPFRCRDCKARFLRFRTPRRRDPLALVRNPPAWARALIWTALTVGVALAVVALVLLAAR